MTAADVARIKKKITTTLKAHANVSPARTQNLLPMKSLQGKLYEAHILATICEGLTIQEGLRISFVGGNILMLRQKGGPINRSYPYFKVWKDTTLFAELFTDLYFATLSYKMRGAPKHKAYGDYHELDIAILQPGQTGYPQQTEVMLAVECKNTSINKNIIRELLGFRRELSFYLRNSQPTHFKVFPTNQTHSEPNSVHMFYCSDNRINRYTLNCIQFGILLRHHRT
jgi:hypothetical protein